MISMQVRINLVVGTRFMVIRRNCDTIDWRQRSVEAIVKRLWKIYVSNYNSSFGALNRDIADVYVPLWLC